MSGTTLDGGLSADPGLLARLSNPKEVNLLGAYSDAARTAEGIWRTRDYQARQAAGQALQGAIDPATGAYSPEAYRQNLAGAGPAAALAAPQGLLDNQSLSDSQLRQAKAKTDWVNNAASALLDKGNISDADIMGVFKEGAANGMMTSGEIAKQTQIVMGLDQAGRQAWARQHQLQHVDAQTQLNRIYGTQPQVDTGPTTQFPTVPPPEKGGAPPVTMGLTPGQSNEVIQVPYPQYLDDGKTPNPNFGRTFPMTKGDMLKLLPNAPPAGGGGLPPSLRNPNKQPGAAPAPAAAPAPTPAFGTTPSGADIERQKREAEQSATGFQSISDQAVASRSRSAILGNMLGDTTQFTTGKLTEQISNLRNYANRLGIPVSTEGLSAQESFKKLAAQLANAQGAGSDARLGVNVAANPHQDLSPAGVDLMIRQLQGNEDYLQARAKLAASYGDPKNVKNFESEVGSWLDPRAFQFARMTGPQKIDYDKSLSDADKRSVAKSYKYVHDSGLGSE